MKCMAFLIVLFLFSSKCIEAATKNMFDLVNKQLNISQDSMKEIKGYNSAKFIDSAIKAKIKIMK
ncbi:MAG: hypothetical protein JO129_03250 [Candidatus Dependentiae bacterium]|nr:hypothetical protein [Candidatus Dependentiae bacterium]